MKKEKIIICIVAALCAVVLVLHGILTIRRFIDEKKGFAINDTLADGGGKDATVILLGGQSNASGCSIDEYLKRNVSEEKYAEYQNGYDNVYINFLAGSRKSSEFVKCATLQGEIAGGFGPELGLAEMLSQLYPDRTFFIIKCAWGGTDLFSRWLSPSSKGQTGDLYKQFVDFVETSIEYLISKNYNVTVAGMCWMQGESDAFSVETSENYGDNLNNFINDIRKEFSKYAADGGIAFVDAYIAANPMYWVYYEAVNRGKAQVAELSPLNTVIDTVAAGLTCSEEPEGSPDMAHYDSLSEIKLGHLFAESLAEYLK